MNQTLNGTLRVAAAAAVWGAAYPLTKLILTDVPPIFLGFLRFLSAGLVFMLLTGSMPLAEVDSTDRRCFFKLAFWGVFLLVLGMNFGLIWAPGIAASVLSGTPPLFTVLLAAALLGEKMRVAQFFSIILAVSGLLLLGGDFSDNISTDSWKIWAGCLLVLVPQFSWAMYGITGKRLSSRYHWKLICRDTFSLGALMLAPVALIEVLMRGFGNWNWQTVLILLYLAIMNSVVTYSLWNSALKIIPVSLASFLIYLQPVSGAVLSMMLFGEKLGMRGMVGTFLIFLALTLVLFPQRKADNKNNSGVAQTANAG